MNIRNLTAPLLFLVSAFGQSAAEAGLPIDLSGTYLYQGRQREATISKLEIRKAKRRTYVHVWFYGLPDDVDWGEAIATDTNMLQCQVRPISWSRCSTMTPK